MQIPQMFNRNAIFILFGILLLAFGLRFYRIGERGLAGDEKYGLLVSQFVAQEGSNQPETFRKPNSVYFTPKEFWTKKTYADFEIAITNRENGTAGLYALIVHSFTAFVGVSDFTLRLPSLIFNLLTIVLLFLFVKQHLKSENLALLSAFLAAVSPFFINYSQIARTYPVLCFFALLSTHLLLLLIERENREEKPTLLYFIYGIVVWANLMSHYSIFPLFFIHGLYCLLFLRKKRAWIGLILAMLIPISGMLYWLKFGGGQWSMHAIQQSAVANSMVAKHFPNDWIAITNLTTVLNQLRHIISIQFIIIDGISFAISGTKNFLLSIGLGLFYITSASFINNKNTQIILVFLFSIVVGFIFTVAPIHHIILSVSIYITYLMLKEQIVAFDKTRFFVLLLALIPILFMVLFAVQDGNTMRIIPRYLAYSYVFAVIIVALGIRQVLQQVGWMKYFIMSFLVIQLYLLFGIIHKLYEDKPLYYFQTFTEPRSPNPYQLAANKILETYAKGDTVIYPSYNEKYVYKGYNMPAFSVQDAQYTNFYLPQYAELIQRVNPKEPNKIILKKADGKEYLIFDFKDNKFRY